MFPSIEQVETKFPQPMNSYLQKVQFECIICVVSNTLGSPTLSCFLTRIILYTQMQ